MWCFTRTVHTNPLISHALLCLILTWFFVHAVFQSSDPDHAGAVWSVPLVSAGLTKKSPSLICSCPSCSRPPPTPRTSCHYTTVCSYMSESRGILLLVFFPVCWGDPGLLFTPSWSSVNDRTVNSHSFDPFFFFFKQMVFCCRCS